MNEITGLHDLRDADIAAGTHDVRKLPVALTNEEIAAKEHEASVDTVKERAKAAG